jgi:hypothetical protein
MTAVLFLEREMRDFIPRAVRKAGTAKVVALFANTTPRAVENWCDGQNIPSAPALISMARHIPELRTKVIEWMNAEHAANDRDPSQVLNEIQRLLTERSR